ncbi:DUF2087 domain-containing protein [Chloroflexi bacterium TSY]|nr:DUF2087 domain-containing protein [Chloroflexi bacterium TSY]
MIEVHRGIEITLPQKYPRGSYHATVTINGRERWFHVNSRSFHNAEDNQYRDAVMAALSQRDDLLFYEYGPDGNKRYANLTHHSAELWQSICRNDVPTLQADDANILARWTQDGRIQSLPRKEQHRHLLFTWFAEKFERDRRYDQDQVWEITGKWCVPAQHANLVSRVVNTQYLNRLPDCSWYWRADSPLAQQPDFQPTDLPIAQWPDPLKPTVTRQAIRKREPNGDYANLKEAVGTPNLDRERKQLVFRLKRLKRFTEAEVDAHIAKYRKNLVGEPADIRAELMQAGLLHQDEDGKYWREVIKFNEDTK